MRELLFRARRIDNGKWVEGHYFKNENGTFIFTFPYHANYAGISIMEKVEPETVCQCTGLKDKNGKKIWENDIVEIAGEDGWFLLNWDEDTARFTMDGYRLTVDFNNYWSNEIEVVSNIFANPELVGKEMEE